MELREERCFISHAVSSHPLLELQTLGLSTLSSPHHQDLPLDSIQKKKTFPHSLRPYLSAFFSFAFFFPYYFTCHLPLPPPLRAFVAFQKTGTLWWLISFIISLTFFLKMKSWPGSGGTRGQGTHLFSLPTFFLSFFFSLFFFVPQLSLLTPSPWIPFLILRMQMIWEGMGVLRLDSLPPPPSPPPSSSSSSFSPGGAGVVWRAEARWEITGMGSH